MYATGVPIMKQIRTAAMILILCVIPLRLSAQEESPSEEPSQSSTGGEERLIAAGLAYSSAYGTGLSLRWDPLGQWRAGIAGIYFADESGDGDTASKYGSLGFEVQRNLFVLQRPTWKHNFFRGFISAGASWSYDYSRDSYYGSYEIQTRESQFLAGGIGLGLAFILQRRVSFEVSFLYQIKERTEGTYRYIGPGFGCAAHMIF
jgi:hypothetical protein